MTAKGTGRSVQQVLENYMVENILFGDGERLREDVSLQESGILDSLGFLDIITFVEGEFNIEIDDGEVVPENFDTLRRMSDFVERKVQRRAAAR